MKSIRSIRTFIGASNYDQSRRFYQEMGFNESVISAKMSYFSIAEDIGFYLQDYYTKDWVNNSMVFLEVEELDDYWRKVDAMQLPQKYKGVKLSKIVNNDWGREFFLHDPAGVLWHIGNFKTVA